MKRRLALTSILSIVLMVIGFCTMTEAQVTITLPGQEARPSGTGNALDFGAVPVGQTAQASYTYKLLETSATSAIVTITPPKAPFGITNLPSYSVTLVPGQSITFTVTYTPTKVGPDTGTFTITASGGIPMQVKRTTVTLTGQGIIRPEDLYPPPLPSGEPSVTLPGPTTTPTPGVPTTPPPDVTEDVIKLEAKLDTVGTTLDELRQKLDNLGWWLGRLTVGYPIGIEPHSTNPMPGTDLWGLLASLEAKLDILAQQIGETQIEEAEEPESDTGMSALEEKLNGLTTALAMLEAKIDRQLAEPRWPEPGWMEPVPSPTPEPGVTVPPTGVPGEEEEACELCAYVTPSILYYELCACGDEHAEAVGKLTLVNCSTPEELCPQCLFKLAVDENNLRKCKGFEDTDTIFWRLEGGGDSYAEWSVFPASIGVAPGKSETVEIKVVRDGLDVQPLDGAGRLVGLSTHKANMYQQVPLKVEHCCGTEDVDLRVRVEGRVFEARMAYFRVYQGAWCEPSATVNGKPLGQFLKEQGNLLEAVGCEGGHFDCVIEYDFPDISPINNAFPAVFFYVRDLSEGRYVVCTDMNDHRNPEKPVLGTLGAGTTKPVRVDPMTWRNSHFYKIGVYLTQRRPTTPASDTKTIELYDTPCCCDGKRFTLTIEARWKREASSLLPYYSFASYQSGQIPGTSEIDNVSSRHYDLGNFSNELSGGTILNIPWDGQDPVSGSLVGDALVLIDEEFTPVDNSVAVPIMVWSDLLEPGEYVGTLSLGGTVYTLGFEVLHNPRLLAVERLLSLDSGEGTVHLVSLCDEPIEFGTNTIALKGSGFRVEPVGGMLEPYGSVTLGVTSDDSACSVGILQILSDVGNASVIIYSGDNEAERMAYR
jgi:hypothetical protein